MGKGKRSSGGLMEERETEKRSRNSKKMKRSPVIIYSDETPKVILADATQFMRMVQSLTGSGSSSTSSSFTTTESTGNSSCGSTLTPPAPLPTCCPDPAAPLGNQVEEESYDSASWSSSIQVSSPESVSFSEAELFKLCEETESSLWTWPPPPPPPAHDYDWPISSTEPNDLMLFFEQDIFYYL